VGCETHAIREYLKADIQQGIRVVFLGALSGACGCSAYVFSRYALSIAQVA
jgi:hypothetical protein